LRAFWEEWALPAGERGPVDLAALARLAARRLGETGRWGFGIGTVLSALRSSTGRGLGIRLRMCKWWGGKELVFWGIGERKRSVRFAGTLEVKGTSRLSPVSRGTSRHRFPQTVHAPEVAPLVRRRAGRGTSADVGGAPGAAHSDQRLRLSLPNSYKHPRL
jgi:hypothetical protein